MAAFGLTSELTEIEQDYAFHYFHPLSDARLNEAPQIPEPSLLAQGDVVLRFGFVEGDAIVTAGRAVYDPQHWSEVLRFAQNGSTAGTLAIVLNETELSLSSGQVGTNALNWLAAETNASVIVVKRGPRGALVYENGHLSAVPAYSSESVFKIGSGDVFSAVFAHYWGERKDTALAAAQFASRAVARYVATKNVQVIAEDALGGDVFPVDAGVGPIYIAGPFFNLGQRWVIEEARQSFLKLGAKVFSPIHDVGAIGSAEHIAQSDLEGLRGCQSVFAVVDGEDAGTLFEVGFARSIGIPVVALAECLRPESLTMLEGSGCSVTDDFTTAIYRSIWASAR
jgi:nucleoside 2-deoxyribosyltransferase